LRQYGKTHEKEVTQFVETHELSTLSVREAMRIINK